MPLRLVSSLLLSSLTIVNEGLSLTIFNKTTNFLKNECLWKRPFFKTIFIKNDRFKTRSFRFSFFRHRFHNETIVFLKIKTIHPLLRAPNYFSYMNVQLTLNSSWPLRNQNCKHWITFILSFVCKHILLNHTLIIYFACLSVSNKRQND